MRILLASLSAQSHTALMVPLVKAAQEVLFAAVRKVLDDPSYQHATVPIAEEMRPGTSSRTRCATPTRRHDI